MSSSMIEYLMLAGISVFIVWRLYTTLGQDDGPPEGRQRGPVNSDAGSAGETKPEADIIPIRPNFSGPAADGLGEIHQADENFDPTSFMQGARSAYKMIVDAFAAGELETLRPMLDDDVYETWSEAIGSRQADQGEPASLLRLRDAEIVEASLDDHGVARVHVRFEAELGDGEKTFRSREIWTFMRSVASPDPNWILDDVDTVQA